MLMRRSAKLSIDGVCDENDGGFSLWMTQVNHTKVNISIDLPVDFCFKIRLSAVDHYPGAESVEQIFMGAGKCHVHIWLCY